MKLEDVGFQWISDSQLIHNTAWKELFSELIKFKQQWGHCAVSSKYAKNSKLGKCVSNQGQQYRLFKSGNKSLISNERIVQFEDVGFQWISDSWLIHKTAWNERFSELPEFKQELGHCNVPSKYAQCPSSVIG